MRQHEQRDVGTSQSHPVHLCRDDIQLAPCATLRTRVTLTTKWTRLHACMATPTHAPQRHAAQLHPRAGRRRRRGARVSGSSSATATVLQEASWPHPPPATASQSAESIYTSDPEALTALICASGLMRAVGASMTDSKRRASALAPPLASCHYVWATHEDRRLAERTFWKP